MSLAFRILLSALMALLAGSGVALVGILRDEPSLTLLGAGVAAVATFVVIGASLVCVWAA